MPNLELPSEVHSFIFVSSSGLPVGMKNNTTECSSHGLDGFDCYSSWGVAIATINAACLVINAVHLLIIATMKPLNGLTHGAIIIHMTVVDIVCSVGITAAYSCLPILRVITLMASGFRVMGFLVEWPIFTSHWIFLITGIERYYRAHKPFKYETSFFIRHLPTILIGVWIFSFGWLLCWFTILAVLKQQPVSVFQAMIMGRFAWQYIPLLIAGVLLGLAMRTLMRGRENSTTEDRFQTHQASRYFIIIYTIFIIITLVDVILTSVIVFKPIVMSFSSRRLRNLLQPVYGVINTIIYGSMSKSYRQRLRKLLCKRSIQSERS